LPYPALNSTHSTHASAICLGLTDPAKDKIQSIPRPSQPLFLLLQSPPPFFPVASRHIAHTIIQLLVHQPLSQSNSSPSQHINGIQANPVSSSHILFLHVKAHAVLFSTREQNLIGVKKNSQHHVHHRSDSHSVTSIHFRPSWTI